MIKLRSVIQPLLLIMVVACDQSHSRMDTANPALEQANTARSAAELVRSVKRGNGRACNHPNVISHIKLAATGELTFPPDVAWNGGWTSEFTQDFHNNFNGDVSRVVLNAHDAGASSVSCSALYTATINGFWANTPIDYNIQISVDQEPIIEILNTRQLTTAAGQAKHQYYCENIYPEQVQQHGTPYALICTLEELQRVEPSRLEGPVSRSSTPPPPPTNASTRTQSSPVKLSSASTPPPSEVSAPSRSDDHSSGPPVVISGPPPSPAPQFLPPPPRDTRPTTISNPSWSRPPTPRFPGAARLLRITDGSAELSCTVTADGSLQRCRVLSETPRGAGFGTAVQAAAQSATVSRQTVDRLAAGGSVTFELRLHDDQPRTD